MEFLKNVKLSIIEYAKKAKKSWEKLFNVIRFL